jgi:hypothetical protein
MLAKVTLACLLAAVPLAAQQEEHPKVPKDSVMVIVTGCLKGRVLRAADVRQTDASSGVEVRGRSFRLSGKKPLITEIKKDDGQRVEVTGLIKKSALREPGVKFLGGRVAIGGGTGGSATASSMPDPAENVLVLDMTDVQSLGGSCGG